MRRVEIYFTFTRERERERESLSEKEGLHKGELRLSYHGWQLLNRCMPRQNLLPRCMHNKLTSLYLSGYPSSSRAELLGSSQLLGIIRWQGTEILDVVDAILKEGGYYSTIRPLDVKIMHAHMCSPFLVENRVWHSHHHARLTSHRIFCGLPYTLSMW